MTGNFNRRVAGYSDYHCHLAGGTVVAGTSIVYSNTSAPGEILGIDVAAITGQLANIVDLCMKLEIDNVTIFDGYIYWLFMGYIAYDFHNLFATCDVIAGSLPSIHMRWHMPFSTMWRITLYSANTNAISVYMNVHARIGA